MLEKQNSIFCAIYFYACTFVHCANGMVKLTPGACIIKLFMDIIYVFL